MTRRRSDIEKILTILEGGRTEVKLVPPSALPPNAWGLFTCIEGHNVENMKCECENKLIQVNKTINMNNKVSILIHECLHIVYRKHHENWIRARTDEVCLALTKQERRKLEAFLRRLR